MLNDHAKNLSNVVAVLRCIDCDFFPTDSVSVAAGSVEGFVFTKPQEDAMDTVGFYTITLVFADDTRIDYQVICWGLEGVFDEADQHFLATHANPTVELSHLVITNQEGVVIARWEGVPTGAV